MSHALQARLSQGQDLSAEQARQLCDAMFDGSLAGEVLSDQDISALRDVVALSTALVLATACRAADVREGLELARQALASGAVERKLQEYREVAWQALHAQGET